MEELKNKQFWFDTETLSFDPNKADVYQFAGIVVINGEVQEEVNLMFKPDIDFDEVTEDTWKFHKENNNLTRYDIEHFEMSASDAFFKIISVFEKYINKFDIYDKFSTCGYNVQFDVNKINALAKSFSYDFIPSFLSSKKIDPFYIIPYIFDGVANLESLNLGKVWDYLKELGVKFPKFKEHDHDALSDVYKSFYIYKCFCDPVQKQIIENL